MITITEAENKILEAARKEFETRGYEGTRMQEIANAAGISKASLHYYFRSKDKLFEKIFEQALEEYIPIVQSLSDDTMDWEEKVKRFTKEIIKFIRHGRMLFIIREINRNPDLIAVKMKNKKKGGGLVGLFEEMMKKGLIRKSDPRLLYIFLNSLCCYPIINRQMFQAVLKMNTKEYEELIESYSRSVADFFIHAIKK